MIIMLMKLNINLTLLGKQGLPVTAGVQAPAVMPRSGKEIMSK